MAVQPWVFRDPHTGRFRTCRLDSFAYDDPMNAECGCLDEIINDMRKRDVKDGCPKCTTALIDNASEPDVMQRWGYR